MGQKFYRVNQALAVDNFTFPPQNKEQKDICGLQAGLAFQAKMFGYFLPNQI